jgi:hypothetical protein
VANLSRNYTDFSNVVRQGYTPRFERPSRRINLNPQRRDIIDFDRIMAEISSAAGMAVRKTALLAMRTADAKVPVRRVFRGGRQPVRKMSISELKAENKMFFRQSGMTPLEWNSLHKMQGVPHFRLQTKTSDGFRDRHNAWRNTDVVRQVERDINGQWRLATFTGKWDSASDRPIMDRLEGKAEQRVLQSLRGRYTELAPNGKLRLKIRDSDVFVDPITGVATMGGSLKHSLTIRPDDDKMTRHSHSIVAGGPMAPYARYVEFGTRRTRAQPYLRPAMKTAESRYRDIMYRELARIGTAASEE